jgi:hypothetical protein
MHWFITIIVVLLFLVGAVVGSRVMDYYFGHLVHHWRSSHTPLGAKNFAHVHESSFNALDAGEF